jgi:hypothetical protein
VSLSMIPKKVTTKVYPYLWESGEMTDFQNYACPPLAMAASAPLDHLLARTIQLLTAFPEHAVLLGLLKLCEKVVKLNLMTTPIAKVMAGMEVILRQAQDWEQHASSKVKLGSPLAEIAQVVSNWRKLELQSWSKLLDARRTRYVTRARRHWMRLHGLLVDGGKTEICSSQSRTPVDFSVIPAWVWKRAGKGDFFLLFHDVQMEELKDLIKAVDTFVLTSPLGEFKERLRILKVSSLEILARYKFSKEGSSWRLQQARTLFSVWKYYDQFSALINKRMDRLSRPIEDKLKNETKLAKWDTQSYYALAESTERNHRKLMKILSEFDEVLDLNVGLIIREESCTGLRANVDKCDDFCTSFPAQSEFFPCGAEGDDTNKSIHFPSTTSFHHINSVDRELLFRFPASVHVTNIEKYAKKMIEMRSGVGKSSASLGADLTLTFCQLIFNRIESLRQRSTRPMKERALVDLFRELKQHGFASTKWSTPSEVRCIEQIFLLPSPQPIDTNAPCGKLPKGEEYYVKCIAETHAFCSEATGFGSKHITKRQIDMMMNLCYSGMFMTVQQRCLLSNVAIHMKELENLIDALPSPERKPTRPVDPSSVRGVFSNKVG